MEKKQTKPKKSTSGFESLYQQAVRDPVSTVYNLIADSNNVLSQRTPVWDRYRRKYRRGLRYLSEGTSGGIVYFTNYIYSNVETLKAILTKNIPYITVVPRGEADDLASDIMSRVLADVLDKGEIKSAQRGVVHNGALATMGFMKTYYSDEDKKIKFESVLPDHMLVDPIAGSLKDARWVIQKIPAKSVEEIYSTYGVVPESVKAKSADDSQLDIDHLYGKDDFSSAETGTYSDTTTKVSQIGTLYDVYECWIRCWEPERENDWYIVTIAGSTALREEFSVYDHNQTPFDVWFCAEDDSAENIYTRGVGVVEEIEPIQDRSDTLDVKIMKHLNLMTNRQRYISSQSGLNQSVVDNTAGRIYFVNGDPSKTVYYDAPPALNQEIYAYRDAGESALQTVSGIFDVATGRRPTGITAGKAISELKSSAETRTSFLSDSLGIMFGKVGQKALSIVFQMYDDDMLMKATDADEDKSSGVVTDYPPELQATPTPIVGEDGEFMADENGEFVLDDEEEPEVDDELRQLREEWKAQNGIALVLSDISYEWDVKVDTDSALPSAKVDRGQMATDMFRLGAIDREALLDTVDFPNRKKILKRIAAEVTGKNAGDPNAEGTPVPGEGGGDVVGMLMQEFQGVLQQMGAPAEVIAQVMQTLQASVEPQPEAGGQPQLSDAQTGNGTFPPQMG